MDEYSEINTYKYSNIRETMALNAVEGIGLSTPLRANCLSDQIH